LPPDFVTAEMIALEDFSYSALKFCVTTRNSWTGVLRERVAAARVLADDAAVQHVVLVARAVDEDVRVEARDRAGDDLLVVLVRGGAHARRQVREVQEVAAVLGQRPELLLRDVRRDLALPSSR
jgi:hypothetical protein